MFCKVYNEGLQIYVERKLMFILYLINDALLVYIIIRRVIHDRRMQQENKTRYHQAEDKFKNRKLTD